MSDRSQVGGAALVSDGKAITASPPPAHLPPEPALPPPPATPPASPAATPPALPDGVTIHPAHEVARDSDTTSPAAEKTGDASKAAAFATTAEGDAATDGLVSFHDFWANVPSWLISLATHLSLVLVLVAISSVRAFHDAPPSTVLSTGTGGDEGTDELSADLLPGSGDLEGSPAPDMEKMPELTPDVALASATSPIGPLMPTSDTDLKLGGKGTGGAPGGDGTGAGGLGGQGDSLTLRLSAGNRNAMMRREGGTPDSQAAVDRALYWLAQHQNYDGSWTYAHDKSPKCHGACANPGFTPGKIAATGMALLPFLGTGQTQHEGQYKQTIDKGLRFLIKSMEMQGDVGSLLEFGGQMYGHGLASIALCEAYGMTHDQALRDPAQAAVNFIVFAQDPHGGGWRYRVQEPGDTSVVGWQLMALKSAQMAYLHVPPNTLRKAGYFLDHVQADRGATYGYQDPDRRRPATTAIGLLSRMYLGWPHDHPPLVQGVNILAQLGPSIDKTQMRNNMYYNYYATQVMHHFGGYPLEDLERGDARIPDQDPKPRRPRSRQLVSRRRRQRRVRRRTAVLHRDGRHDLGSLLPLHAVVSRSERQARAIIAPPCKSFPSWI